MERTKQFEKSPESEVRNAIDAFEQILQAMPGDRTALETLYDAHIHIGDPQSALGYLLQIANLVVEEGDTDSVPWVFEGLVRLGHGNSDAAEAIKGIETMMLNMGMPSPTEMSGATGSAAQGVDVTAELALAWTLRQANELTQDEYSTIVQDLTENSTKNLEVPVSVQHVLFDRKFSSLDRVLAFMARDSGCPVVHLPMFELDRAKFRALDMDFVTRRGALVFEQIGDDYLVALLNPYDQDLKKAVSQNVSNRCHFFSTSARDYDAFLLQFRQMNAA